MIQPRIRSSLTWSHLESLTEGLAQADRITADHFHAMVSAGRLDEAFGDSAVRRALLSGSPSLQLRMPLAVFMLLSVADAMHDVEIDDIELADYLASMVLSYGHLSEAAGLGPSQPATTLYVTDLMQEAAGKSSDEASTSKVRIAEVALWLTGVCHEWVAHRRARRGAPGLTFYENLGEAYYAEAASSRDAYDAGMQAIYERTHASFRRIRIGLNTFADRHLFPAGSARSRQEDQVSLDIERLLRHVADASSLEEDV